MEELLKIRDIYSQLIELIDRTIELEKKKANGEDVSEEGRNIDKELFILMIESQRYIGKFK